MAEGVLGLKRGTLRHSNENTKLYRQMGKDHSGDSGSKPVDARVARRRQDAIGRRLRQMFDDVVNEGVPDEFLSLLDKADRNAPPNGDAQKKSADVTDSIEQASAGRSVKTES